MDFIVKTKFPLCAIKVYFHTTSFAPSLAFVTRFKATRKLNGLLSESHNRGLGVKNNVFSYREGENYFLLHLKDV